MEFLLQIATPVIVAILTGYVKNINDNFKDTNKMISSHLMDRNLHTECGKTK